MRRGGVMLVGVVAAVAVVAVEPGHADPKRIVHGSVGPGSTITLKDGVGATYVRGAPGMYVFIVSDRSNHDDFHLTGPHVNTVITGVAFVGGRTVALRLGAGVYRYRSDTHPKKLSGTFTLSH